MRKQLILAHGINNFLFNQFRFFGSRKLGRAISKVLLPSLEQLTKVPTIYNFDMMVNRNGGKEIYYLGFYEVGTLNVIDKCLSATDNFIDVGASIGLMSVFAAYKCPKGRVFSFEPQKERFEILQKNGKLNNKKNMRLFNNGLGEKEEQLQLHTDIFSPSIVDIKSSKGQHEMIDILVLDRIVEAEKIEAIKFIKIDVEGFELSVLKGAEKTLSKENAPIICIEYVKRLQSLNNNDLSIFEYIKKVNNYRLFQLEKTSNTISKLKEVFNEKNLRDCDNVYCFTEAHIKSLNYQELFK